jgi:hypothetical protein
MASDELPLLTFADASAFEDWLAVQPENAPGAWLKFAKKGGPETTVANQRHRLRACSWLGGWADRSCR